MEEFLPFLVLIGIVVMNAIGQKKKRDQRMGRKPGAPPRPPPGQRPPGEPPVQSQPRPLARPRAEADGEDESSEGMIPSDVWEEILGLARGRPTPVEVEEEDPPEEVRVTERPRPRPAPEPTTEAAPWESDSAPETWVFPASHGAQAALHRTDAGDFESRLGVAAPSAKKTEEGEGISVRVGLFGDGSSAELRKAIILQEVLGAPIGLREE